jgi:hypothetical protein
MRRALDSPFGPAASVSYRAMMEAWNRYQTGQDMASIVAAMSPNAIKSILLGYKVWPDQGVVNQFGQTVLNANELTPADRYWRMAGFQPSVASERYISRNEMQTRARFDRAEAANLNGRVARLVQEKAKAVNAGDSKTAAEVQKRIDEQITDGFKRGLITNSAAFLRALSARMAQDQSPLLNEIMKLPKNIRLEFLQRWLKQQGQRTAAPSSQAPPPPFVPPPPTYSLPPGHR